jgi:hypothetical protein
MLLSHKDAAEFSTGLTMNAYAEHCNDFFARPV